MPFDRQIMSGRDPGRFAGEHRSGAAEARHDLVGDQEHVVARAKLARQREVVRVVHRHPRRALHQRLDDERGDRRVMAGEVRLERGRGANRRRRAPIRLARAPRASGDGTVMLRLRSGA